MADREPPEGAASPLTWLLKEEAAGDGQLDHAVFLSYSLDLAFFESVALGLARSLGARVTVVGDARVSAPDPRAIRQAGRSYLAGLAVMPGAFHPKIVILTGQRRCLVAIGSGNTTLAGWQNNKELWTVFRGTADEAPAAVHTMAAWLRALPVHVRFSRGVAEALRAAAGQLESFPATDEGTLVLDNLQRPLLEKLPVGPVDELRVSAPFHDPGATALRALVDRLQPQRLTVALQPGRTMVDGPALARLLEYTDGELISDPEPRYRHGKLIEWRIGATLWAVTGSANVSSAALRGTPRTGGNCELAVLSTVAESLLPRGRNVPAGEAASERIRLSEQARSVSLLGATLVENGLLVEFATTVPGEGWVEYSEVHEPPETWRRLGVVPPGTIEMHLPGRYIAGSRVRLVCGWDPATAVTSQIVLVADLAGAASPAAAAGSRPQVTVEALLGDSVLATRFLADLATLRAALSRQNTPAAAATPAGTGETAWEVELRSGADLLGLPLIRFALGRPQRASPPQREWTEQLDVDESHSGLDEDSAEEDVADDAGADQATQALRAQQLAKLRRWAVQLAAQADGVATLDRLLPARLLLSSIGLGAWDPDDDGWYELVAAVLEALGRQDTPPREAEAALGSIAAVGLALMRTRTPRYDRGSGAALAYRRAVRAVEHLLPAAEPDLIGEYTQGLAARFGSAVEVEAVWMLASELVQNDPIADAIHALEEQGKQVHADHPAVLHVNGEARSPAFAALEAVAAAQDTTLGAWAGTGSGRWTLLLWRNPDLYRVDATAKGVLWRHYRCNRRITPRALLQAHEFDLADRVRRPAMLRPIPEAIELMRSLGLDPARGISCPHGDGT
ncbi:hypothetical protein ACIA5G_39385 [Amycolatopsis sp. NPDC051758]|uniref:hypothetical protein n=1 Tax=Amycolatopsis sp. NPDC051758 TaxID=3363935 RepID=UPI0037A002FF